MIINKFNNITDWFYSWLGYQFFITPFRTRPPSDYHQFMHLAQDWFYNNRTDCIERSLPRHYVIHYFSPQTAPNGHKILITHGWMSCATWMAKFINDFTIEGYEVYALDFPAHGEAKGVQIIWEDAVAVIRDTINEYGPFYAAVGHSFGGSMLINAVNLSGQLENFKLSTIPEQIVTMGSPTRMRIPVYLLAKRLQLSANAYKELRRTILTKGQVDPMRLQLKHLMTQNIKVRWICIHGEDDDVIHPYESQVFCEQVPNSQLILLPKMDHLSLLMDDRITENILQQIKPSEDSQKFIGEDVRE